MPWRGADEPLTHPVGRGDSGELARCVLEGIRVPRLQILATVTHPQTPHERPAAAVVRHVVIGIEQLDNAAQHFPRLFEAGTCGFDTQPRDRDQGGWRAGMRAQRPEFVVGLLDDGSGQL